MSNKLFAWCKASSCHHGAYFLFGSKRQCFKTCARSPKPSRRQCCKTCAADGLLILRIVFDVGPVVQKLRQALLLAEGQRPAEERERRPPRVRSVQSGVASLRAAVRCRSRPRQRQASIMQLVWLKDIATESMMDEYCNRSATNSAPTQGNHPRRKRKILSLALGNGSTSESARSNPGCAFPAFSHRSSAPRTQRTHMHSVTDFPRLYCSVCPGASKGDRRLSR